MRGVFVKTFESRKINVYLYTSLGNEQFDWLYSTCFNHFDTLRLSIENYGNFFKDFFIISSEQNVDIVANI